MKIRLTDYSEKWAHAFEQEAAFLQTIFKEEMLQIEHFGSTAVAGMKAKPVIDMLCIVKSIEHVDTFNEQMSQLGYDVAGEWGIAGRRLFRKGGEERTHHIHFYEIGHPEIARHLIFRDYLKVHPQEVAAYSNFKQQLATRYETTSEYSPAKKQFVSEMEKNALRWAAERELNY